MYIMDKIENPAAKKQAEEADTYILDLDADDDDFMDKVIIVEEEGE